MSATAPHGTSVGTMSSNARLIRGSRGIGGLAGRQAATVFATGLRVFPVTVATDRFHCRRNHVVATAAVVMDTRPSAGPQRASPGGHTALLHSLGAVGDVPPTLVPWLLRLSHVLARTTGGDSRQLLEANACCVLAWRAALREGLLPDSPALAQLVPQHAATEAWAAAHVHDPDALLWPAEPLNTLVLRVLAKLQAPRFAAKYPAVQEALLRSLLELVVAYYRTLAGEKDEEQDNREVDADGNRARTAAELAREEVERRIARGGLTSGALGAVAAEVQAKKAAEARATQRAAAQASLPAEKRVAVELARGLYMTWGPPLEALSRAGRAFEGLEALLGGADFNLQANVWKRPGWVLLDSLRRKLEDLRELRDLVRSLGRGGGWGPLRRAPMQRLDMSGRPGLLRTVLEAQETRGLTRSGDISRLLPGEAALLARGRSVRASKLLFLARLVEQGLQTYERDGWGEFPTRIVHERREVRPTADRGPILLCVDTSGSMRGARETVAKALALECMRAAREQERDCYVFAFAGPAEVRELELNANLSSVNNLLDFLEKVFNGGSDFNEPVRRCLDRLTDSKWANSDILLVSDGELRSPGPDIMRKLWGAKESLGLRVHGLIVGSPDKKRADPAVLRSLCTAVLPSGRTEVLVTEFAGWASVQSDSELGVIDWDDVEGNAARRLAGLAHEKYRQDEAKRLRVGQRAAEARSGAATPRADPMRKMWSDGSGAKAAAAAAKSATN